MNILLDGQGWGDAVRKNIGAVLESVDRVFRPCFGPSMNTNDLLVIHSDDHPVTDSCVGLKNRCVSLLHTSFFHKSEIYGELIHHIQTGRITPKNSVNIPCMISRKLLRLIWTSQAIQIHWYT